MRAVGEGRDAVGRSELCGGEARYHGALRGKADADEVADVGGEDLREEDQYGGLRDGGAFMRTTGVRGEDK